MATRSGVVARALRVADADEARVRRDIALGRRIAGLSQSELGKPCGLSRSQVARIEAGSRPATIRELACLGAAVGHDVRLRAYPGGDPIRDAGQQRRLAQLRSRIDASLRWRTEVALPIKGDLRAWDAVIDAPMWHAMVELETVVEDVQALERRLALKVRDGRADHVLLAIADTRRNRRALDAAPGAFAEFDRNARRTLRRLSRGVEPPARSLVFL